MKSKFKIAMLAIVFAAGSASATSPVQTHIDSLRMNHKVITIGSGNASSDSVQKLIDQFYYDQFRNSQEPDAPYFLLMSKNADMAMGIGGSLRVRGWYDWGAQIPAGGFVTANIPVPADPAAHRALNGNVAGSRLYFKVLGNNKRFGDWQVYLEAKFSGGPSGMDFKLSKAYAIMGDWTLGYATSTFADPAAQPYTVDSEGPNAAISDTDVLLRWMHTFNKNWVVAASVEMPNADDAAATANYSNATGYIPNLATFFQYQWSEGQHVRLSGIMRFLPYRDLVKGENKNVVGWGVKGSAVFRPCCGPLTVYLDGWYGNGIASITNDLGGAGLDLVGDDSVDGRMVAPAAAGVSGALQYNFSPSVFATVAVSELRFLPGESVVPSTYRYGLYGAANVVWYVTPRFFVGAEFDMGARKNFSMESEWAHRAGLIAQLMF